MDELTDLTGVIISQYVCHVMMLYTLNFYNVVWQVYLDKAGEKSLPRSPTSIPLHLTVKF